MTKHSFFELERMDRIAQNDSIQSQLKQNGISKTQRAGGRQPPGVRCSNVHGSSSRYGAGCLDAESTRRDMARHAFPARHFRHVHVRAKLALLVHRVWSHDV